MPFAPIALFAHARPDHVRRTIETLLKNPGAASHDLIVFSDAARAPDKQEAVNAVRSLLQTVRGFRSVTVYDRPHNFGLARSIIEGVSTVLATHESVIVLEDDMETSPHFLAYMNGALDRFKTDERVISVHGYVYPVDQPLPEAFFLHGADCWGWATWRRGWNLFNEDGRALLEQLRQRQLLKSFDFNGSYPYSKMLKDQINGKNDSWAIRWYASAFLAKKLTLYPGRSLVHNIGNDDSGTHCGNSTNLDVAVSQTPISLEKVSVTPSAAARSAIEKFFRRSKPTSYARVWRLITNALGKISS